MQKIQVAQEPAVSQFHSRQPDSNLDDAYTFLRQHGDSGEDADLDNVRRMCDWHIMPILFITFTLQSLDKQLLNYAAVTGILKDLHLTQSDFSNAATALFAATLAAEIPNAYFVNKLPVPKWLALNATLWGVATACTAVCTNRTGLIIASVFLGLFEAAVQPSLTLITSQYYRKDQQTARFVVWGSGLGLALIVGGLMSFGLQHVHHAALAGWRIMYLLLGCLTIIQGVIIFIFLPDTPMKVRFLSTQEKAALLHHVAVNKTGVSNTTFHPNQIPEFFSDPQIWFLAIITVCISVASGVINTYSATLIRNFGYTPKTAALLNIPSGVINFPAAAAVAWMSTTRLPRWSIICIMCSIVILGAGLMSFAPFSNRAALLAGLYLVNCVTPVLCVIYQWIAANVAGQTKRSVSVALITAAFSAGSIIGPQTFRAKDAPQFIPAKITLLALQAAAAGLAGLLGLYYYFVNRRRDRRYGKSEALASVDEERRAWENLTDRERESFRYVY